MALGPISGKMKRRAAVAASILFGLTICTGAVAQEGDSKKVFSPLPPPTPVNEARARLGEMLFFDTRLSGDTSLSCASCHDPAKGWGDGQAMSNGYTGVLYFRNAPGLFNAANRYWFTWDGRLDGTDGETLVRDMMTEAHTMNMDTRLAQERLKQVPEYLTAFKEVYGADPYGGLIYGAIAEYLKTIRTMNAPFDAYLRGNKGALSDSAKRGMTLFSGKANCTVCHAGPTLSDSKLHATGAPDHPELQENADRQISMLRHFASMGTPNYMNLRRDVGHYAVTKDEADIGKFVTPSLWDIGQTGPYMHSGVFGTLREVVDFYDAGGGAGDIAGLEPLGLSESEKADLIAFLESLTGDAPAVSAPEAPDYDMRSVGEN